MSFIFISYRRSDSGATATALRQSLVGALGKSSIYHDVVDNTPGVKYPDELRAQLEKADTVLVLIGENWLSAANEWNQRRIDFEDDWVRFEISSALTRPDVTLIPVLIDGAKMPPAEALPGSISELSYRQSIVLRHSEWEATTGSLIAALGVRRKKMKDEKPDFRNVSIEEIRNVIRTEVPLILHFHPILEEISNVLTPDRAEPLEIKLKNALKKQLNKLVGRLVRNVDATIQSIFPNQFTINTANGRWKGYSEYYKSHAHGDVDELNQCLLVLPDSRGRISGAVLTTKVIIGYNSGIAPTSIQSPLAAAGLEPGLVVGDQYYGRMESVVISEEQRLQGLHSTFGY